MRTLTAIFSFSTVIGIARAHDGHPHVGDSVLLHHGLELAAVGGSLVVIWTVASRFLKRRSQQQTPAA